MAVPAGPTEKRYTGNGVTKIFTIPFLLIAASDLDVFIDGVEVMSGFTITGAGNPTSTITFSVAPANLSSILLALNVPFERLNDYQENGDFLASTVNRDFDRIWQALKQLLRGSVRALTLGTSDVDGAGWYRAKGNGIRDLADPVETHDAATKGSVESYVNGLIGTGQGPVNNAANVLYATGGGITRTVQSRLRDVAMITDFTGAVEGAGSSSASAFAAAEASAFTSIYLPFGVWNAGTTVLTKRYYGLGKIITNGAYRGQEYVNMTTDPQRASTGDFSTAASADISKVNLQRFDMGRIRNNLSEYYYNSATTPNWADGVWLAGSSGTSCKFTNPLSVGATSINMIAATAEILPGMQIKISNDIVSEVVTCQTNVGTTLTFTPPLTQAMNVTYTTGPTPTYGYVGMAARTMNQMWMGQVEHQGGGDAYVYGGRIIANNKARQAGQDHFFETQTVGLIGGDLLGIAHGSYLTGMELSFHDTNFSGSYQIAAAGLVYSFNRTSDRAVDTFGCFWMGSLFKSEGSAYADVAYRAYGKWKRGLDFTGMDLQGDQAAMILQRRHKIYFDGSGVAKDPRGFSWFADTPGGSWIGTGTSGDVVIAQGGLGRLYFEDANTRLRAKTAGDHVILDRGYLDLFTEVTPTAGASQGYATIFINGASRKIQVYAMP